MDTKQKFTLLVIAGLIILGIVGYYLVKEIRETIREKAKAEMIAQGIQEAKNIFGQFKKTVD